MNWESYQCQQTRMKYRKDQSNSSLRNWCFIELLNTQEAKQPGGILQKYSEIFEFMKNNNLFKRESQHLLLCGCDFLGD